MNNPQPRISLKESSKRFEKKPIAPVKRDEHVASEFLILKNGHKIPRLAVLKKKKSREGIESLIRQLLRKNPSPFMIILKDVLEKQYHLFRKYLPRVMPYYAIKANPHPDIIRTFVKLGCGFDVASAREMKTVLKLGAAPNQIIFANTIKSEADIAEAYKKRVKFMTFDNEPELYKIAKHCPRANVLIRIKVANIGSLIELSLKFGADSDQAVELLQKAKKLNLRPRGVALHVGSQCKNSRNYSNALRTVASIFEHSAKRGISLDIVDIGGGFPIRYFDADKHIRFEDIAKVINRELAARFDPNIKVIAEPGRLFVGPAGILVAQVIGRTFRNNRNYYYLNSGLYQDFSGILFDHAKYEFKTLRRGQKFLSTLAGPTCDSLDVMSLSEELPELDLGNVVYAKNIGAYSSASAVLNFNGFPAATTILV